MWGEKEKIAQGYSDRGFINSDKKGKGNNDNLREKTSSDLNAVFEIYTVYVTIYTCMYL